MNSRSKTKSHGSVTDSILCFAPAKLNLALHVTGTLVNGYHQLESLVAFCDIGDYVSRSHKAATDGSDACLTVEGPFGNTVPVGDENIIIRAVHAFSDYFSSTPADMNVTLEKNLPIASGIGGGSADAAATLLALHSDTEYGTFDELSKIAVKLGADVPMCLHSSALIAKGIGDEIETIKKFPELNLLLVNPGISVSTPPVFGALVKKSNPPLEALPEQLDQFTLVEWLRHQRNDLEEPAIHIAPEIADTLSAIGKTRPLLARMSGSGATCFGIYKNSEDAEAAASQIRENHVNWWVRATRTRNFGTGRAGPLA